MGLKFIEHLNQLPGATNAGLAAADLIPIAKSTGDQALPISELDLRYAALGNGVAHPVAGVASSYKIARGVTSVTGTATVVTGLATVVSIMATAQSDLDGGTLDSVSATIGDQAGAPAAGSVILKCWKVTTGGAAGNPTLIAATAASNVNWVAIGT